MPLFKSFTHFYVGLFGGVGIKQCKFPKYFVFYLLVGYKVPSQGGYKNKMKQKAGLQIRKEEIYLQGQNGCINRKSQRHLQETGMTNEHIH